MSDLQAREQQDLVSQLRAYFLGAAQTIEELENGYHRLCEIEETLHRKQIGEEPDPLFLTRTKVCQMLLGDRPIYELYPEADARGVFELPYDDMVLREQYYFGAVPSGAWSWKIDPEKENPKYKEYREQLYQETIDTLCATHPAYIFSHLSKEEQEQIQNEHAYAVFQTGTWESVLVKEGDTMKKK